MIHSRHGVGVELIAEQKQTAKLLYGQRVVTIRMSPDIHQQLAEKARVDEQSLFVGDSAGAGSGNNTDNGASRMTTLRERIANLLYVLYGEPQDKPNESLESRAESLGWTMRPRPDGLYDMHETTTRISMHGLTLAGAQDILDWLENNRKNRRSTDAPCHR